MMYPADGLEDFQLENCWCAAMDSGVKRDFTFSGAVSYMISCDDQEEIDYYWDKLSAVAQFEQCGWCIDGFGVSWQIAPHNMDILMKKPGAFFTLMGQKKIVIADY